MRLSGKPGVSGIKKRPCLSGGPDPAREARRLVRQCRRGPADLAAFFALTSAEAAAGLPLTFVPATEWLKLEWPEVLPPWEEECDGGDLRATDILTGAWLSWYFYYTVCAWARRRGLAARRLSGEVISRVLLEELYRDQPPEGAHLFASHAVLVHPFTGVPVCRTCAVHDEEGSVYAAAAAWNAWVTDGGASARALERWAARRAPEARQVAVWRDPETREPFVFSVADVPWLVDAPVADRLPSSG